MLLIYKGLGCQIPLELIVVERSFIFTFFKMKVKNPFFSIKGLLFKLFVRLFVCKNRKKKKEFFKYFSLFYVPCILKFFFFLLLLVPYSFNCSSITLTSLWRTLTYIITMYYRAQHNHHHHHQPYSPSSYNQRSAFCRHYNERKNI